MMIGRVRLPLTNPGLAPEERIKPRKIQELANLVDKNPQTLRAYCDRGKDGVFLKCWDEIGPNGYVRYSTVAHYDEFREELIRVRLERRRQALLLAQQATEAARMGQDKELRARFERARKKNIAAGAM